MSFYFLFVRNSTIVPDVLRKIQEMLNGLKSQVDAGQMVVTENGESFPAKSLNMTSSSWGCASGQQLQENGCCKHGNRIYFEQSFFFP